MNTEDKLETVDKSVAPGRELIHVGRVKKIPEVGDKALCGYVKKKPVRKYQNWEEAYRAIARGEADPCIVCFEMSGRVHV